MNMEEILLNGNAENEEVPDSKSEIDFNQDESTTFAEIDSAYGSPTDDVFEIFQGKNQVQDDWRFQIHPQDIYFQSTNGIFKQHVMDSLIISDSIFSERRDSLECLHSAGSSCSPWEIFSQSDILEEDSDEENTIELSGILPYSQSNPSKDKAFHCSFCSSSFSRNHDLKRHLR
jgi:hypothetical protein